MLQRSQSRSTAKPRRVRLVLRDGAEVDGGVFLGPGQALAPYLSSRKSGWVNLISATWSDSPDESSHAVLQADQLLVAIPLDPEVPVLSGTTALTMRGVELRLEDGRRLRGKLHLGDRQRLADYLHAVGKFIPLTEAAFTDDPSPLGDVALNAQAVRVLRDLTSRAAEEPDELVDDDAAPVRRSSGATPIVTPALSLLSDADAAKAERLAQHWLSRLSARFRLLPADPRRLAEHPGTAELWSAIAHANSVDESTFASSVAAALRLPLADLARSSPAAATLIPGRVARRHLLLPIHADARSVHIATCDPSDLDAEQAIRALIQRQVQWHVAPPSALRPLIEARYPADRPTGSVAAPLVRSLL
ncbi:MAG: hypothetical protein SFW08_07815 [Gemmatimonadaceae bacterium]|nr:hypothetical protein [Gemmatimonadaceae bacterium]